MPVDKELLFAKALLEERKGRGSNRQGTMNRRGYFERAVDLERAKTIPYLEISEIEGRVTAVMEPDSRVPSEITEPGPTPETQE